MVGFLDVLLGLRLRHQGMRHYLSVPRYRSVFPLSLSHVPLLTARSGSEISYWHYQPPKSARASGKARPLVLIHGIGSGLGIYMTLIAALRRLSPEVPLFCVELPHVSMRFVRDVPEGDATARAIAVMLRSHGHDRAVFLGHRYWSGGH